MAEIGLAASIIAVIQITAAVTTQAYKYGQNVAKAKEDIERVREELINLEGILKQLKELASRADRSGEPCKYTMILLCDNADLSCISQISSYFLLPTRLISLPAMAKTYR
jgi:hypothetical protein